MKRSFAVVASVTVSLVACRFDDSADAPVATQARDSAGVQIVESVGPAWEHAWTIAPEPRFAIGGETTEPGYELYRVSDALLLPDGRLVIANSGTSELRWFGPTGELIRSVGGRGDGPGEFASLQRIFPLPADSLAATDAIASRITIFDGGGEVVRTVSHRDAASAVGMGRFTDGAFLLASYFLVIGTNGPERIERVGMTVHRLDESTQVSATIATPPWREVAVTPANSLDGILRYQNSPRPFGTETWVAAHAAGWVLADNARTELELRAPDGKIRRIIRWSAAARAVTPEDVARHIDWAVESRSDPLLQARVRAALEAYPPPPDSMPVFGCGFGNCPAEPVLLDPDGNIWVLKYVPPSEQTTTDFFVFDSTGVWLGSVNAPVGTTILHVGRDAVVVRRTDDLGVETVAVHALLKPDPS